MRNLFIDGLTVFVAAISAYLAYRALIANTKALVESNFTQMLKLLIDLRPADWYNGQLLTSFDMSGICQTDSQAGTDHLVELYTGVSVYPNSGSYELEQYSYRLLAILGYIAANDSHNMGQLLAARLQMALTRREADLLFFRLVHSLCTREKEVVEKFGLFGKRQDIFERNLRLPTEIQYKQTAFQFSSETLANLIEANQADNPRMH